MIASPLTSLLKGKPSKLKWNEEANQAYKALKERFTSAPILKHPDPELPFVVEVDALDCGNGAVLSQRHGQPGKLYPCAFFSRKLRAAERNSPRLFGIKGRNSDAGWSLTTGNVFHR